MYHQFQTAIIFANLIPFFQIQVYKFGTIIRDKVFKNGPSKICGRQPLKNLKGYGLLEAVHTPSNFLKAVFHKFYLGHS